MEDFSLWKYDVDIEAFKGAVFSRIGKTEDQISFFGPDDSEWFRMYHSQDCCESVTIEDICGDMADLIGSPIIEAEVVSSENEPAPEYADSYTWTFYKLGTIKGHVTIRWLGESNGYYSEEVDIVDMRAAPMNTIPNLIEALHNETADWKVGPCVLEVAGELGHLQAENDRLRTVVEGIASLNALVRQTNEPDRIKWEGVWYDGPLATAYIQTIEAITAQCRRALK